MVGNFRVLCGLVRAVDVNQLCMRAISRCLREIEKKSVCMISRCMRAICRCMCGVCRCVRAIAVFVCAGSIRCMRVMTTVYHLGSTSCDELQSRFVPISRGVRATIEWWRSIFP